MQHVPKVPLKSVERSQMMLKEQQRLRTAAAEPETIFGQIRLYKGKRKSLISVSNLGFCGSLRVQKILKHID
jgi:hypothetical protein